MTQAGLRIRPRQTALLRLRRLRGAALAGAQAVGAARDPRRAWALAARIAEDLER